MSEFWKHKRVLVTGGTGFIGSHLVEALVARGSRVTVPTRSGRCEFLAKVLGSVDLVHADLANPADCERLCRNQDIVMYLAAKVGGVAFNMAHPGSLLSANLLPFMNTLEAARQAGVERFLVTSSACVYPRVCSIPTPESEGFKDRPEFTNEGYGWAKRMEEFLGEAYHKEFGLAVAIARPYNAYGPRDNFDPASLHVIPALIKRVVDGEDPVVVWGDGSHTRSFIYVSDFVRGLLAVAERYAVARPLNIGADDEISVRELIELIVKISGSRAKIVFDPSKPTGQPRRHCDVTLAAKEIGFRAEVPFSQGLAQTIEWYRGHRASERI